MRTQASIELAIHRLELMRREREQTPPPKTHESLIGILTASAEAVALDAALDALHRELKVAKLQVEWAAS